MTKQSKYNFLSALNFIIVSVIALFSFWIVWSVFFEEKNYFFWGNVVLALIFYIVFLISMSLTDGFKVNSKNLSDTIFSQLISISIATLITYLQISLRVLALQNPLPFLITIILCASLGYIWTELLRRFRRAWIPADNILMIYSDKVSTSILNKLKQYNDRYKITGLISEKADIHKIYKASSKYDAVMLFDVDFNIRTEILKYCYSRNIKVYVSPKITDIVINGADNFHIVDSPLFLLNNEGIDTNLAFVKRVFDILISLVCIIITSPIMLVTAICIKAHDGGSVIYKQERYTKFKNKFNVWKFRSMTENAEADHAILSTEGDSRVTKVGKFIRKTRIDELPQLFNILGGSMSLIGPRPERPEIAEKYSELVPEFMYRLKVKAGLTGYAQVYGKYNTTAYDKLRLDLLYIENYSLILDFKILLLTIRTVFKKEATEGFKDKDSQLISEMIKERNSH